MRLSEKLFRSAIFAEHDKLPNSTIVTSVATGLGIPVKRANYLLSKWAGRGWWEYGVSLWSGWLTAKGATAFRREVVSLTITGTGIIVEVPAVREGVGKMKALEAYIERYGKKEDSNLENYWEKFYAYEIGFNDAMRIRSTREQSNH